MFSPPLEKGTGVAAFEAAKTKVKEMQSTFERSAKKISSEFGSVEDGITAMVVTLADKEIVVDDSVKELVIKGLEDVVSVGS